MTAQIHGHKVDYWGKNRDIISLDDHALVRPIAKEINWPIAEAIRFNGVDRRYLRHELPNGRTKFTIAQDLVPAFREAGLKRARHIADRHERRLREDTAYQERVEREKKQSAVYAEHRRETAEALTTYQAETAAADKEYGEARVAAGAAASIRKTAASTAYNDAVTEADEDRDEALAALNE